MLFFVEENVRILCNAKDSHILSKKVFVLYLLSKLKYSLQIEGLMTALANEVLNNWAQDNIDTFYNLVLMENLNKSDIIN